MRFGSDNQRKAMFANIFGKNVFSDKNVPKYLYHKTDAENLKNIVKEGRLRSNYTEPVSMSEDENPLVYFRKYENPVVVVVDSSKIPERENLKKLDYQGKEVVSVKDQRAWAHEREWNARQVPMEAIVGVTLNERIEKKSNEHGFPVMGLPTRSIPKDKLKDLDVVEEFTRDETAMGVFGYGQKVYSEEPKSVEFIKPVGRDRSDYVLVDVDMGKFDESWKKDSEYYVGEGGKGGIGSRYDSMKELLSTTTEPIDAPEVTRMHSNDVVSFTDGRHRVAALRDLGAKKATILVPKEDKEWFEDNFGV